MLESDLNIVGLIHVLGLLSISSGTHPLKNVKNKIRRVKQSFLISNNRINFLPAVNSPLGFFHAVDELGVKHALGDI